MDIKETECLIKALKENLKQYKNVALSVSYGDNTDEVPMRMNAFLVGDETAYFAELRNSNVVMNDFFQKVDNRKMVFLMGEALAYTFHTFRKNLNTATKEDREEVLKGIVSWALEEDENWNWKQIAELDFKRERTTKKEDLN